MFILTDFGPEMDASSINSPNLASIRRKSSMMRVRGAMKRGDNTGRFFRGGGFVATYYICIIDTLYIHYICIIYIIHVIYMNI
jgi:hypothetical protein